MPQNRERLTDDGTSIRIVVDNKNSTWFDKMGGQRRAPGLVLLYGRGDREKERGKSWILKHGFD